MFKYIEDVLHTKAEYGNYENASGLPLYITGAYVFYTLKIKNSEMILAVPNEDLSLSVLRKQHRRIEALTGKHCVFYLKNMTYYSRDRMLEEDIPFVWEGKQVYIPFLGVSLTSNTRSELPYCPKISYLTQKLLFTAIYQEWKNVNVTAAAGILGVSKMSVSRCFDELEALGLKQLTVKERKRTLTCDNKREFWEAVQPILIDPVISRYALRQDLSKAHTLGGLSALAGYSMLNDNPFPTYAVTKSEASEIDLSRSALIPPGEIPACVVIKVGYRIEYGDGTKMDPLSVALAIDAEDRKDPRVEQAIEEMLEEYVW